MKLYNLSPSDDCPCIVIKFKSLKIMLDCSIDFKPTLRFLPVTLTSAKNGRKNKLSPFILKNKSGEVISSMELKEYSGSVFIESIPEFGMPEKDLLDLSTIDVILISNYQNMLALPYITEYSGFHGTVYMTEPTHHIGRLIMQELSSNFLNISTTQTATKWKNCKEYLPKSIKGFQYDSWCQYFNLNDIKNSLSKIHVVGYDEKFSLFGALDAVAYSSGYALGSCNWSLETGKEKIIYMSGSSTLTTHPEPMNTSGMKNADILIFNGLSQTNGSNPDNMLAEFCNCLANTVKSNGNVLIPCYPSGLVYDLLECLLSFMKQSGIGSVPIYFVSSVAKDTLAFSQIYSEWLHPNKKNKVYLPEPPFSHEELIEENKLKLFTSVHEGNWINYKNPCIVFAGHPTLRCGNAVHFLDLWSSSANNSVIFVEPNINYVEALSPYQPMQMKSYYFPIDTRSGYSTSSKIINELEPKVVVVPTVYTKPPILSPHRQDLILSLTSTVECMNLNSILDINIKASFEQVKLSKDIAASVLPTAIKPGIFLSSISGDLHSQNNKYILTSVESQLPKIRKRRFHDGPKHRSIIWGKPQVSSVLEAIKKEGYGDAKVEVTADGHMILLQETIIVLEPYSTHIVCDKNEKLRNQLKDILLKSLTCL